EITGALTMSGGVLTGGGVLTVSGLTTWTGGTMGGSGRTIAQGGMTLGGTLVLDTRALDNAAAATWTGSAGAIYLYGGAGLTNRAGATFDLTNDTSIYLQSGAGSFTNAGTFRKSGGSPTNYSYFSAPFNNTGT